MTTSMTVALATLRERLYEASNGQWQDVELRRWIMEGATDIARRAEVLLATGNVTITAAVSQYTLALTDIVRVHRVEFTPTGQTTVYTLDYRDWNSMDSIWWSGQNQGGSIPSYYTMWGFTPNLIMKLYPVPSTGGIAKLFYYRLPTSINTSGIQDANLIEVPEGWIDLVFDYAEFKALRRDRDPRWQEAKSQYDDTLNFFMEHSRRWTDQVGQVVPQFSPIPAWLYAGDSYD